MKIKVFNIVNMVLCALVLCCLFLPFLRVDALIATASISTIEFIQESIEDGNAVEAFCLIIPCFIPVAVLVLCCFQKRVMQIINALLAISYVIWLFLAHFILIPQQLAMHSDILDGLAGIYVSSLSYGFYIPVILMAAVSILAIVCYVTFETTGTPTGSAVNMSAPSITVISGIYQGAVFLIQNGETILIGRDASQCHVIIEAEQISRRHCGISFYDLTGQYRVTDYSSNGTFINHSRRMVRDQVQFVERGALISLGDDKNMLRLN